MNRHRRWRVAGRACMMVEKGGRVDSTKRVCIRTRTRSTFAPFADVGGLAWEKRTNVCNCFIDVCVTRGWGWLEFVVG